MKRKFTMLRKILLSSVVLACGASCLQASENKELVTQGSLKVEEKIICQDSYFLSALKEARDFENKNKPLNYLAKWINKEVEEYNKVDSEGYRHNYNCFRHNALGRMLPLLGSDQGDIKIDKPYHVLQTESWPEGVKSIKNDLLLLQAIHLFNKTEQNMDYDALYNPVRTYFGNKQYHPILRFYALEMYVAKRYDLVRQTIKSCRELREIYYSELDEIASHFPNKEIDTFFSNNCIDQQVSQQVSNSICLFLTGKEISQNQKKNMTDFLWLEMNGTFEDIFEKNLISFITNEHKRIILDKVLEEMGFEPRSK